MFEFAEIIPVHVFKPIPRIKLWYAEIGLKDGGAIVAVGSSPPMMYAEVFRKISQNTSEDYEAIAKRLEFYEETEEDKFERIDFDK